MGCLVIAIVFGLVGFDAQVFEAYGLWGLVPVAFELLAGWLILYFSDPFGY